MSLMAILVAVALNPMKTVPKVTTASACQARGSIFESGTVGGYVCEPSSTQPVGGLPPLTGSMPTLSGVGYLARMRRTPSLRGLLASKGCQT